MVAGPGTACLRTQGQPEPTRGTSREAATPLGAGADSKNKAGGPKRGCDTEGLGGGPSPGGLAGHWLWPPERSFLFLISVYLPIEDACGSFQCAAPARPPCRLGTSTLHCKSNACSVAETFKKSEGQHPPFLSSCENLRALFICAEMALSAFLQRASHWLSRI